MPIFSRSNTLSFLIPKWMLFFITQRMLTTRKLNNWSIWILFLMMQAAVGWALVAHAFSGCLRMRNAWAASAHPTYFPSD